MGMVDELKRFQGCLVGLAVGNALGMPVEGWTKEQIRMRYGVLNEMVNGIRPAGTVTDDTMQAICIAESIAEIGHFDADDIMRRLLNWYRTDPFGIGMHTWRVLKLVDAGVDWRDAVERVEQLYAPMTAGNGSLMRCAPIGMRYYREIGALLEYSAESSQLTHLNELCVASCVFFNAVLSRVLQGWGKTEAVSFAVEVTEHVSHEVHERVEHAMVKDADELSTSGFVLDTLECALWAWWHYDDFEMALVAVVNLGGDTDTNGAVTGALIGAHCGVDAIPKRWLNKMTVTQKCIMLATKLFELAQMK
ncbi:MAG: ADP-ribosylglycohydrolase family protein [Armatimonadota bacterium]|nr:ADP-ribosylglycohydrolase family protein [Armatimonadota bacterium]MDW8026382.1 ADP-ribosylglycohydrolase family protein [Armatimonadota bacterium]